MKNPFSTFHPPRPQFRILNPSYYLDSLLFWSVFASTSILMLWLLLSEAERIIRLSSASQIISISTTTASAISNNPLFGAGSNLELLRSVVENNSEVVAAGVVGLPEGRDPQVLFSYRRPQKPHVQLAAAENHASMRSALRTGAPTPSAWEFLNDEYVPLLMPRAEPFEYVFVPLTPSRGPAPDQPLLLSVAFDAPAIQARLDALHTASATIVAITIVVATVLSIFVRFRSVQRLDALETLQRRTDILRLVAEAADALLEAADPVPVMNHLLRDMRQLLAIDALYLVMGDTLAAPHPGQIQMLGELPGYRKALAPADFLSPELAPWKKNLLTAQFLPFEKQPQDGPPDQWLHQHGISALAAIPILKDKRASGLLLAESRAPRHHWDPSVLNTLKLTADLYGASLTQREHNAQMLQSSKMEALGRLAGGVAHEFNNLLHIISGNLRRLSPSGPQEISLREKILAASERGASIVSQLLRVSRHSDPQLRPAALQEVVQRTLDLARPTLGRDIVTDITAPPGLPALMMEEAQIQQVLLNLVINSRDAMQGRGRIHCTLAESRSFLLCEVSDTGPGFPPQFLDRVFEPFFTTKPPGEGTGLGLSTCKAIVEQHGGFILADNAPGGGAVVTLYFPLSAGVPDPAESSPTAVIPAPHNLPMRTVLICDDEQLCREVLADNLKAEKFPVLSAADGREAVELARKNAAQIGWIVTDWTMPGLHGQALLQALQEAAPEAARIVTSGYVIAPETIPEMHAFLQKPFTPDQLLAALQEALQRSLRTRA